MDDLLCVCMVCCVVGAMVCWMTPGPPIMVGLVMVEVTSTGDCVAGASRGLTSHTSTGGVINLLYRCTLLRVISRLIAAAIIRKP